MTSDDKKVDTRNLIDQFKGRSTSEIVDSLDANTIQLEIACENTLRDFNMGAIVRTANAFGVRHVHIVGRRSWNKRGAMATNKYLHVHFYDSLAGFVAEMRRGGKQIVAIENNCRSEILQNCQLHRDTVLVFGQEGEGLSQDFLSASDRVVRIEQYGSTRSMNVGHAAAIAMYEWSRQHHES